MSEPTNEPEILATGTHVIVVRQECGNAECKSSHIHVVTNDEKLSSLIDDLGDLLAKHGAAGTDTAWIGSYLLTLAVKTRPESVPVEVLRAITEDARATANLSVNLKPLLSIAAAIIVGGSP